MSLYLALNGTTKNTFGIKDTNASHFLNIVPGSNLTADRSLNLVTGDADRTVTINGNVTLNDWFDQSVKTASGPTFLFLTLVEGSLLFTDPGVAHGMTDVLPTNQYGQIGPIAADVGGFSIFGLTDADQMAVSIAGVIGTDNPTDTTPVIVFTAYKKYSTTTVQALGAAETAFQFKNANTALVTILGSGNVGIGTVSPSVPLNVKGTGSSSSTYSVVAVNSGSTTTFYVRDDGYCNALGTMEANNFYDRP